MAYREFRNELLYKEPTLNEMPFVQAALSTLAEDKAARRKAEEAERQRRQKAADDFKIADLKAGKYTYTQDQITQGAIRVKDMAVNDFLTTGYLKPETQALQEQVRNMAEQSQINWNRAREMETNVNQTASKKPWYRTEEAFKRIKDAEYGNDGAFDESRRNENLNTVQLDINNDPERLMNTPVAISEWMKTKQALARQSSIENGDTTTQFSVKSLFRYDPDKKALNITTDDVNQYFEFEPAADKLYTQRALALKRQHAERYVNERKAAGEKLNVDDVYNQFIAKPETNPYDKSSVGAWKYKLASDDIRRQAGLEIGFEVSQDEPDKGKEEEDKLLAPTPIETEGTIVSGKNADGSNRETAYKLPGLGIKSKQGGKVVDYAPIVYTGSSVFTTDNEKGTYNNKGNLRVNANQMVYGLVTPSGRLVPGTDRQTVNFISKMKKEDFLTYFPNAIIKGEVIDEARTQKDYTDEATAESAPSGSLLTAGSSSGSKINKTKQTVYVPLNQQVADALKTATGREEYGQKTDAMKQLDAAYIARARQVFGEKVEFKVYTPSEWKQFVRTTFPDQVKKFGFESVSKQIKQSALDKGKIPIIKQF